MPDRALTFSFILVFMFINVLWLVHSLILLPSLYFLLVYSGYLITSSIFLLKSDIWKLSYKLLVLLPTVVIVSSLSYVGVPWDVAHIDPDSNYVEQLVKLYIGNGRITMGIGTGEAPNYSFYPFTETLYLILCSIMNIDPSCLLRTWFIISSTLSFLILYIAYKQIVHAHIALIASFIAVTMFRCNFQLVTNPTHPSMAFLFLTIFLFLFFKALNNRKSEVIVIIVTLVIAIIHNTTAPMMLEISAFYFILRLVLGIGNRKFASFDKSLYRLALLLSVFFFSYNLYVAFHYFEKGVVPNVLDFLTSIIFKEFSPIKFFSAKYELYISKNTTKLGLAIVKPLFYFGYISAGLFISLFLLDLLRRLIKRYKFSNNEKTDVIYLFSVATLGSLVINSYFWFAWRIASDYYYRFFAYTYIFLAIPVTSLIVRLYKANAKIKMVPVLMLTMILAQSLILTHPVSLFGTDTPLTLEDVRIGPRQAISIAYYLENYYDGNHVFGTRYAFNIIGPRAIVEVSELRATETLRKGELNIISLIESKILNLKFPENFNILFSTGGFWIAG